VARIIEQVGGTLRAESEPGRGSEFYFNITMPRHDGTATNTSTGSTAPNPPRSPSVGSGSGSLSSMQSSGVRELNDFVDAFSVSHMARSQGNGDAVRAAEARMNQPGTFPVADSSWPIKPAKTNSEKQSINPKESRPSFSRSQSAFGHQASRSPPLRITTSAGAMSNASSTSAPHSPTDTSQTDDSLLTTNTDEPKARKARKAPIGGKLRILVVEVNNA